MNPRSDITIHRTRRVANFTIVNNAIMEDLRLSPRARFALIYLLSKPDDWSVRIPDLRRVLGTKDNDLGRDSTYAVITELIQARYIIKRQSVGSNGRYGSVDYFVFDQPCATDPSDGRSPKIELVPSGPANKGEPQRRKSARQSLAPIPRHKPIEPVPGFQEPDATPLPDFPDAADQDPNKKGFKPRILPLQLPRRSPADEPAKDDGFEGIWQCWPEHERPKFANAARKHFRSLSEEERVIARKFAQAYQLHRKRAGLPALMIPYLHKRAFLELANGPPINGEGWFRVEPGRPEWVAWLGHHALKAGPKRVARIEALGFLLTPSRWPPGGHGSAQACAN